MGTQATTTQTTTTTKATITTTEETTTTQTKEVYTKRLLCIRHAQSISNEYMSRPGNQWGEPTFQDDDTLLDSPLSTKGRQQVRSCLPKQLQKEFADFLPHVQLVIVSPLTRCLQTFVWGVYETLLLQQHHQEPVESSSEEDSKASVLPPILALPLLTERVYTISDTGRPIDMLQSEFPMVNFSYCHDHWWYSKSYPTTEEWRPHGQGQWYAVPGEPKGHFEQRMIQLDQWIQSRPEQNILMVAHWAVLRHLTKGTEWNNAEGKLLEWRFDPITGQTTVTHIE